VPLLNQNPGDPAENTCMTKCWEGKRYVHVYCQSANTGGRVYRGFLSSLNVKSRQSRIARCFIFARRPCNGHRRHLTSTQTTQEHVHAATLYHTGTPTQTDRRTDRRTNRRIGRKRKRKRELEVKSSGSFLRRVKDMSPASAAAAAVNATWLKPGFHPNAIACVACVAFGWKPG